MAKTGTFLNITVLLTFLFLGCVKASSSELEPLVPVLCPHNDYETNTCYHMVNVNRTCVIVTFGLCNDGGRHQSRHHHRHWWTSDICWTVEENNCTVYKCEKKCCEGWSTDNEGRCDQRTNDDDIKCENGLVNLGGSEPTCECLPGFSGETCAIPHCEGGCKNGGTCRQTSYWKHACHCPPPFTGQNCETVTCLEPCMNGGTCVSSGGEAVCVCPINYYGKTCKHRIDGTLCPMPNNTDWRCKHCRDECINTAGCQDGLVCCSDGCKMKCMKPVAKTCYQGNRYYRAGENFQKNPCTYCTCMVNGTIVCEEIECAELECDGHLTYENSSCCPVCRGHSGLPEGYKRPSFSRCYHNIVLPLNLSRYSNTFYLSNLHIQAWDYTGNKLQLEYNPNHLDHCGCSKEDRGTRMVSISAVDGFGGRSECNFWVYLIDPIPPVFLSCPADIDAYEDEIITWDEPRAMDNVGIRYLWSSIDQGQVFDVGEHTVTYSAIDYDDNKAICEFNVNVYGEGTDASRISGLSCRKKKHHHAGLIVGTVCGVLALIILVLVSVFVLRRRRQQVRRQAARNVNTVSNANYGIGAFPDYKGSSTKPPDYTPPTNPPAYDELNNGDATKYAYASPPHYDELSLAGDATTSGPGETAGINTGIYETTGGVERDVVNTVDNPTYGHMAGLNLVSEPRQSTV